MDTIQNRLINRNSHLMLPLWSAIIRCLHRPAKRHQMPSMHRRQTVNNGQTLQHCIDQFSPMLPDLLSWFQRKELVHGGISADSYRILAMFHGTEKIEEAAVSIDVIVKLPGDLIDGVSTKRHANMQRLADATNVLRDEVYIRAGTWDDDNLLRLALSIGDIATPGAA